MTLPSLRAISGLTVVFALVLGALTGCKQPPRQQQPAIDSKPAKKTPPMPWVKKKPSEPTTDESWIKDLTAISAKEAVRRYLALSTEGDLTKVKPYVTEKCYKTPIGAVTSTLALGSRLTKPVTVKTTLEQEKGDAAVVGYEVQGSLKKSKKAFETNIFGVRVEVRAAGNSVSNIKRTGKLQLKRIAGKWQLDCPKLEKVKPGFVGVKVRKNFHKPHLRGLPGGHKGHKHDKQDHDDKDAHKGHKH